MSEPFRFDPASAAAEIVRALEPRRVWCGGPGADELGAALGTLGVEVRTGGPVDLAVLTGPVDAAAAIGLASHTASILFAGADLPLATVRLLSGLGFLPQPDFEGGSLGGVLFRRTGALPAELAAVADAIESQRIALDRLDAHVALAQRRVE